MTRLENLGGSLGDGLGSCEFLWDLTGARVNPACVQYISIVPSAAAALVLGYYVLQALLPARPLWLQDFAAEESKYVGELRRTNKAWTLWTVLLLLSTTIGLAISIISALFASQSFVGALSVAPWAVAVLVVGARRPKSTPALLVFLYGLMLVCQITVVVSISPLYGRTLALRVSEICLTVFIIIVILMMPMRSPDLDSSDVCLPSRPPTHHLRSPEDNMTLWHFMTVAWMAPLISLGKRKQLNDEDVWLLPYEFQHSRLHYLFREVRGSVLIRLLQANALDLIITTFLGILESAARYSTPVLLQQLLRSIEDPKAAKKTAITYAALILAVRLIATQSGVFSLWFCRRCYERSRGEMVTMVFEKALSRKAFGSEGDVAESKDSTTGVNGVSNCTEEFTHSLLKRRFLQILRFLRLGMLQRFLSTKTEATKKRSRASMGKILNLLRNDVYEVAQRFWECQNIITKPLGLLLSVTLVWKLLGWPCLIGVSVVIAAQLLNILFVRVLLRLERVRRLATDTRLQVSSQFIEAIRHLRWYDWQMSWLNRILESRQHELRLRVITGLLNVAIASSNFLAGCLFPVIAFAAYTLLAGQPLRVDVAFPAIQLFSMLDASLKDLPELIRVLLNANIALGRIEDFMSEPNKEDSMIDRASSVPGVVFSNASFAWPGFSECILKELDISFSPGLSLVCGRVGQGKSALLQAALGELDKRDGRLVRPDAMIGYCSQSPWLQSMSIRDNILFGAPYNETRYKQTLDACALIPDFAGFKHGDLSNVGENGIGLSGGQRARVALARAVYSRATVLLLDDPIAALDHGTATTIVQRLFGGSLVKGRTVILVTHRVDLCAHLADQIVEIREGRATVVDKASFTTHQNALRSTSPGPPREEDQIQKQDEDEANAVPDKFIEEEHRAKGGVVASVYWQYVKAGDLRLWLGLVLAIVFFRISRLSNFWFLKSWGEAYGETRESSIFDLFGSLPSPEVNVRPWLIGFLIVAVLLATAFCLTEIVMLFIVYVAGKHLFKDVLHRVSNATFRFYDTTPIGRLMNRLTSDFGTLDGNITYQLQNVAWCSISWLSAVVIIASTTPLFLIFTIAMTATFVWIFMWFLPTSQSLRRLEMVSLSPLLSNFGTLLEGLTTVRAFHAQAQFQARVIVVTDAFQKMDHFYWSLQAWLMFRFDSLSAISIFLLTLLALYDNLSQGLTAFVLTTAANFVNNTHFLCKQYGQLQMEFVSVERVVELLDLEQEPTGSVQPPASWPSYTDDVIFDNVTIKYAPHLDPALSGVSFRIPGGSTTAIIGRTGSGKSTLALTLLATMLPESDGHITIGSIDLSKVNVHTLRQRVTFVAQDPVLFPGTLRQNLDPGEAYSDDECTSVLNRIFATTSSSSSTNTMSTFTLTTPIETGGKNLSQGQRQLIGLGRAILRRSPVVILDEATASIDTQTALEVQRVLREELAESTVIMIAHRVEAVREASWAVVLDKGRVVASGKAEEVVEKQFMGFRHDR